MDDKKSKARKKLDKELDPVKLTAKKKRLEQRRKIEELMEQKRISQFTDDYAFIM